MPVTFGSQEPDQDAHAVRPLPKAEGRARPKFTLMLHPDRWMWDSKTKEYVPELTKLKIIPGLQGVDDNGNDQAARAYYTAKGYIIVSNGDPRLAKMIPGGKYRTRWVALGREAGKGVFAYGWPWEGYEWVGNKLEWQVDAATRNKFLRGLVALGIVPPITASLRNQKLREEIRVLERMEVRRRQKNAKLDDAEYLAQKQLIEDLKADIAKYPSAQSDVSVPEELRVADLELPDDEDDDDPLASVVPTKKGGK